MEHNADFAQLPFTHMHDGLFARRLPDTTGDELIVELRMQPGESVAMLQQWLADARIASEDLMQTLAQRRLQGAFTRRLTAQEIQRYSNHPSALLFNIKNITVELDGKQVPTFAPGQSLLIQGSNQNMPIAISLCMT